MEGVFRVRNCLVGLLRCRGKALALAVLGGGLYALGFCGFDHATLAWICLIPILWALDDATLTGRQALGVAWLFGLTIHLLTTPWLYTSLRSFFQLSATWAALGYIGICVLHGSLYAVWGWSVHQLTHRAGAPLVVAAPATMVLVEWLWPSVFPWHLAASQYRFTLILQTLDVWGPLGLSFIITLTSAVLYQTLAWRLRGRGSPGRAWLALTLLAVTCLVYGAWARDR
ncbi:MAG: hypothetical protein AB8I80_21560 [Anaerolineae bacterium]